MRFYIYLNVSTKKTNIITFLFIVFFLDTLIIDSHFQLFVLATQDYSGSISQP